MCRYKQLNWIAVWSLQSKVLIVLSCLVRKKYITIYWCSSRHHSYHSLQPPFLWGMFEAVVYNTDWTTSSMHMSNVPRTPAGISKTFGSFSESPVKCGGLGKLSQVPWDFNSWRNRVMFICDMCEIVWTPNK